jgi:hypothetical protein
MSLLVDHERFIFDDFCPEKNRWTSGGVDDQHPATGA